MDPRTDEQREADEELEAAIHRVAKAYEFIEPEEIITQWVCVGGAVSFTDRYADDSFFLLTPDQHMPPHMTIGLLRYGQITIESATAQGVYSSVFADDDDEIDDSDDG